METVYYLAGFAWMILSAFALRGVWTDKTEPLPGKLLYTAIIALLPRIGATIYFRAQEQKRRDLERMRSSRRSRNRMLNR